MHANQICAVANILRALMRVRRAKRIRRLCRMHANTRSVTTVLRAFIIIRCAAVRNRLRRMLTIHIRPIADILRTFIRIRSTRGFRRFRIMRANPVPVTHIGRTFKSIPCARPCRIDRSVALMRRRIARIARTFIVRMLFTVIVRTTIGRSDTHSIARPLSGSAQLTGIGYRVAALGRGAGIQMLAVFLAAIAFIGRTAHPVICTRRVIRLGRMRTAFVHTIADVFRTGMRIGRAGGIRCLWRMLAIHLGSAANVIGAIFPIVRTGGAAGFHGMRAGPVHHHFVRALMPVIGTSAMRGVLRTRVIANAKVGGTGRASALPAGSVACLRRSASIAMLTRPARSVAEIIRTTHAIIRTRNPIQFKRMKAIRVCPVTKIFRTLKAVNTLGSTGRALRHHVMSTVPDTVTMITRTAMVIRSACLCNGFRRVLTISLAVAGIRRTLFAIVGTRRPRRSR